MSEEEEVVVDADRDVYVVIDALAGRVQLFVDGYPRVATKQTGSWRLVRDRVYEPVYDNNDGGDGQLSLYVATTDGGTQWEETDYVIAFDDVDGHEVRTLPPFVVVA